MRTLLACVVAAVLLAPSTGFAGILTFRVSDSGELPVSFGLLPFELSSPFESLDGFDVDGLMSLVSGPLLSQDVDAVTGVTIYRYGAGLLTLDAAFVDNGAPANGSFTAATQPFEITVREGADPLSGNGLADDFVIDLGTGLFDANLATFFHVGQITSGGGILLGLEDIEGDPDDQTRFGFDHRGEASLEISTQDVPEPGVLALALCAAVLSARKKLSSVR